MHEAGFVHGNVCPEHFHIANQHSIRLETSDAWDIRLSGVGWLQAAASLAARRAAGKAWHSGSYVFDPERGYYDEDYASPEQAQGEAPTVLSDIYSWAVTMTSLYHGNAPYTEYRGAFGPNLPKYLNDVFSRCAVQVPAEMQGLLARCLLDPQNRPGCFGQVLDELTSICEKLYGKPYLRPPQAPDPAAVCNNRALYFLDLKRPDISERLFVKALEFTPGLAVSEYNLTMLRLRQGTAKEAEYRSCISALRSLPDSEWKLKKLTAVHDDPACRLNGYEYYCC